MGYLINMLKMIVFLNNLFMHMGHPLNNFCILLQLRFLFQNK